MGMGETLILYWLIFASSLFLWRPHTPAFSALSSAEFIQNSSFCSKGYTRRGARDHRQQVRRSDQLKWFSVTQGGGKEKIFKGKKIEHTVGKNIIMYFFQIWGERFVFTIQTTENR